MSCQRIIKLGPEDGEICGKPICEGFSSCSECFWIDFFKNALKIPYIKYNCDALPDDVEIPGPKRAYKLILLRDLQNFQDIYSFVVIKEVIEINVPPCEKVTTVCYNKNDGSTTQKVSQYTLIGVLDSDGIFSQASEKQREIAGRYGISYYVPYIKL